VYRPGAGYGPGMRRLLPVVFVLLLLPATAAATPSTEADKDGFATSHTLASQAWYTLDDGRLTEVLSMEAGRPVEQPSIVASRYASR
jgi:hypothetical protein